MVHQYVGIAWWYGGIREKENKKEKEREREAEMARREEEEYSDPDEGVEMVDMENVRQMDWMAPESLRKEKEGGKRSYLKGLVTS